MRNAKGSVRGFTLIEILVTLGIMVILGGVVFINLSGRRTTTDLSDTSEQVAATLREAQSNATAQKNGVTWGVHFYNATSTGSFYALFSGSSYASGTVVGQYTLPNDVQFASTSVSSGGTLDITFAQVTGMPSASTSIILYLVSGETTGSVSSSASVSRSSSGKVFFDNFTRSSL